MGPHQCLISSQQNHTKPFMNALDHLFDRILRAYNKDLCCSVDLFFLLQCFIIQIYGIHLFDKLSEIPFGRSMKVVTRDSIYI